MKNIIKVLPLAAMIFTLSNCAKTGDYSVNFETSHGTWKAEKYAFKDKDYIATYVPEDGYVLSEKDLIVKVNDKPIKNTGYTFLDNQLTIDKEYVIGNINIKAEPNEVEYKFEFVEEGDVISIGASLPEGNPKHHKDLKVKFAAFRESYRLPDDMNVYVSDKKLTEGYEYNKNDRTLLIKGEFVTGDVKISATAIELTKVIFNGNGGHFDGSLTQTIYVDKGQTFKDAKAKLGTNPVASKESDAFDHWEDKEGKEVPDSLVVTNGMEFNAKYSVKKLHVEVNDNHSYFPTNYYEQQTGSPTINYGSSLNLTFKIKEGDETKYAVPKALKEVRVGTRGLILGQDYNYTYQESPEEGNLTIFSSAVKDDVHIVLYTSSIASISFNPGEGTWDGKSKENITANIRVGGEDDIKYTYYEAIRILGKRENDPIPNNPEKSFLGWSIEGSGTSQLVNENSIIDKSVNLVAQYGQTTFENDSWSNVVRVANQGLDYLLDYYSTTRNNLIGCTRVVVAGNDQIGYVKEKVRVIGIGADMIAIGEKDGGKKAALTFEYCNSPIEDIFSESAIYSSSSLRRFLNAEAILMLPKEIQKDIKLIEKITYNPHTKMQDKTNDKLFILSANELGLQSSDMPGGAEVKGEEGEPYEQYTGTDVHNRRIKGNSFKDMESTAYWIRSADWANYGSDTSRIYSINDEGDVQVSDCKNDKLGIAFAFAIGVVNESTTTHKGSFEFQNCNNIQSRYRGNEFTIIDNVAGSLDPVIVHIDENPSYIFSKNKDEAVTISTKQGSVTVASYVVSEDSTSATLKINYDALAASPSNQITITIKATVECNVGSITGINCTPDIAKFYMIKGVAGGGHIEATAMDGYLFNKDKVDDNISYEPTWITGGVITFTNIIVSDDQKTISFDFSYTQEISTSSYVIIKIESFIEK